MASSDEAPEKAQKRAKCYSHFPGGRQHKRQPASWEITIGRRDGDKAKDRVITERLRRQNWSSGRHPCKLGTRPPAAVWACQGALALLAKKPNLVMELYPAAQPRVRWAPGRPDPNTMTAEERLAEVGEIMASGILRVLACHNNLTLSC